MAKCEECEKEVKELVPMGLLGTCYHVCNECKDKYRIQLNINSMSYGMKVYFETGVDPANHIKE